MNGNYAPNLLAPDHLEYAIAIVSASFPQSCLFTKWGPTDCPNDNPVAEGTAKIMSAQ